MSAAAFPSGRVLQGAVDVSGVTSNRLGLVDATAAAELLSVPVSWIRSEARAGRLPHRKLGRYVRFSPDELLAFADEHRFGPATGSGPVSKAREAA